MLVFSKALILSVVKNRCFQSVILTPSENLRLRIGRCNGRSRLDLTLSVISSTVEDRRNNA